MCCGRPGASPARNTLSMAPATAAAPTRLQPRLQSRLQPRLQSRLQPRVAPASSGAPRRRRGPARAPQPLTGPSGSDGAGLEAQGRNWEGRLRTSPSRVPQGAVGPGGSPEGGMGSGGSQRAANASRVPGAPRAEWGGKALTEPPPAPQGSWEPIPGLVPCRERC